MSNAVNATPSLPSVSGFAAMPAEIQSLCATYLLSPVSHQFPPLANAMNLSAAAVTHSFAELRPELEKIDLYKAIKKSSFLRQIEKNPNKRPEKIVAIILAGNDHDFYHSAKESFDKLEEQLEREQQEVLGFSLHSLRRLVEVNKVWRLKNHDTEFYFVSYCIKEGLIDRLRSFLENNLHETTSRHARFYELLAVKHNRIPLLRCLFEEYSRFCALNDQRINYLFTAVEVNAIASFQFLYGDGQWCLFNERFQRPQFCIRLKRLIELAKTKEREEILNYMRTEGGERLRTWCSRIIDPTPKKKRKIEQLNHSKKRSSASRDSGNSASDRGREPHLRSEAPSPHAASQPPLL